MQARLCHKSQFYWTVSSNGVASEAVKRASKSDCHDIQQARNQEEQQQQQRENRATDWIFHKAKEAKGPKCGNIGIPGKKRHCFQ